MVENTLALLRVPSWFFVYFVFSPKHSTVFIYPTHRACRAFRGRGRFGASRLHALFTVLCSLGRQCRPSVLWGAPAPPAPLPKTGHSPPLNPNNPTTHHTIRHPQNLSLGSPFSQTCHWVPHSPHASPLPQSLTSPFTSHLNTIGETLFPQSSPTQKRPFIRRRRERHRGICND